MSHQRSRFRLPVIQENVRLIVGIDLAGNDVRGSTHVNEKPAVGANLASLAFAARRQRWRSFSFGSQDQIAGRDIRHKNIADLIEITGDQVTRAAAKDNPISILADTRKNRNLIAGL